MMMMLVTNAGEKHHVYEYDVNTITLLEWSTEKMIRTHSEDKIPRTEEMQDYAVKRLVLRMASLLDFETGE